MLDHYLEVLDRKPGALPGATALAQAKSSGVFTTSHQSYWDAARRAPPVPPWPPLPNRPRWPPTYSAPRNAHASGAPEITEKTVGPTSDHVARVPRPAAGSSDSNRSLADVSNKMGSAKRAPPHLVTEDGAK